MKGLFQFLVTTNNRYNNIKNIGGKELIVNSEVTERDAQFVNRVADVIATPSAVTTPVEIGDQIIVHHNVFRTWYDQQGNLKDGSGFLGEDKFMVHLDQVFAYKKKDGWVSAPRFVFVSPIKDKGDPEDLLSKTLGEISLRGIVKITNEEFEARTGALYGSEVGFTPDSEYEFYIDGEKLYRIREQDINIIYDKEETTGVTNSIG